ncbi:hypothetical protein EEJ42_47105 [Streptomyces botrytidirepellens]|uniref:Uncharacterized protein n=1 Tax=Streptomyces botrytidirepellens TaxID=2486417 RepID=A0A3M8SQQ1_9ACTN|nr:hypothetical protein EEJ42_47105 [Streptomyces botrytidirepellens]
MGRSLIPMYASASASRKRAADGDEGAHVRCFMVERRALGLVGIQARNDPRALLDELIRSRSQSRVRLEVDDGTPPGQFILQLLSSSQPLHSDDMVQHRPHGGDMCDLLGWLHAAHDRVTPTLMLLAPCVAVRHAHRRHGDDRAPDDDRDGLASGEGPQEGSRGGDQERGHRVHSSIVPRLGMPVAVSGSSG